MTYDKVQFAINRHHYTQHGKSDKQLNYTIEAEKITVAQPKQKRKTSVYESALTNIKEVTEKKSVENNAIENNQPNDSKVLIRDHQHEVAEKQGKDLFHSDEELKDTVTQVNIQFPKYSLTGKQTSEDNMSSKTRRSSGCDVRKSEKDSNSISSKGKYEAVENSDSFESEQNSAVSVPKLNLGESYVYRKKAHIESFSENGSNKGIGIGSPIPVPEDRRIKLPNVKCEHLRDLSIKQKHNVTMDINNGPDRCMVCEITEATANYASVDANRLLLEIVYPHEFYDKFQRSGKRTRVSRSQRILDATRDQINICKPATVGSKTWRRERTTILPSQPITTDRPDPPNTMRDSFRSKLGENSEHDLSPQKRIKTDGEREIKKEIHLQCRAKNNALVVTDDTEGQKLVLKGLKGWIMKKDDTCKNKIHTEIKKSLYQVNSLGMNFSIPEYNTSLSDRKLQFIRPVTSITSPRLLETQQPIRRSVTQNHSPRNHVTFQNPPRDIQSVPTRTINGLQRGYTQVPKLFSDAGTEDSFKGFQMSKVTTNNEHKTAENGIPFHKGNTKLSLPPIGSDVKSRSLTFSNV